MSFVRKSSAQRVPDLLTDGQKKQKVKLVKQLLKVFPKYGKKIVANSDENWVHHFLPVTSTEEGYQ